VAKQRNVDPSIVAVELLVVRDSSPEERVRLMPDPELRRRLAGFFAHSGRGHVKEAADIIREATEGFDGKEELTEDDEHELEGLVLRAVSAMTARS
jgi:hypothetical protein